MLEFGISFELNIKIKTSDDVINPIDGLLLVAVTAATSITYLRREITLLAKNST